MELPRAQVTRAVIQRYARVVARLGEDLGERPLVLPNAEFFPDRFAEDAESVQRLSDRMRHHAGMSDIPVRLQILGGRGDSATSGCSSGACAPIVATGGLERLVDTGDEWQLNLLEAELRHPTVLTTNIARALAYVFLVETKDENEIVEPPVDITADMVAVALGFGALMMQGSYIYAKSCGGPSVATLTKMSCGELAIAFALFIARGDHPRRAALAVLDTTQQALLKDAQALLDSNRGLLQRLKTDVDALIDGAFDLQETRSWFSRVLFGEHRDKADSGTQPTLKALESAADVEELERLLIDMPPSSSVGRRSQPPPDPVKEELRQLVGEAFGEAATARTQRAQ